ncbi:MAG: type I restriction enzyme HsdR N-terminal domain-containing protein [Dehalococcoidia bacterium]|nr:type I restriction enzyme HsdR N-terminal domain-containing protein [Dehalococcoidia bacterium]
MDFIDRIRELGSRIGDRLQHIQTEEATKIAFVQPFIRALGYDVNDPTEVVPELAADIEERKGEKVDYAILKDGTPIILIECKWSGIDLDKVDAGQLRRYFSVTESRLAILTNGVVYRFYSDLEKPNIMDSKPFLELDLLDIKEPLVDELKKLTKETFDIEDILSTASELKYTREIKRILAEQMTDPSDDFVRLFASQVYSGRMTQAARQQFTEMTKRAFHQLISDRISERLKSALAGETATQTEEESGRRSQTLSEEGSQDTDGGIVTTEDEVEGYYIVKSIVREVVLAERIAMRDRVHYCSILLDDSRFKTICRLRFNRSQKYLGIFDQERKEERIPIDGLDEIYQYSDQLRATVRLLENPPAPSEPHGA